jgi:hypothetical protein
VTNIASKTGFVSMTGPLNFSDESNLPAYVYKEIGAYPPSRAVESVSISGAKAIP